MSRMDSADAESAAKGNLVPDPEERYALFLRFLREAIDESGWKHEALAAEMGITKGRLSDMLRGETTRPVTVPMALRMPREIYKLAVLKFALRLDVLGSLTRFAVQAIELGVQARRMLLPARAGPGPMMEPYMRRAEAATSAQTERRQANG